MDDNDWTELTIIATNYTGEERHIEEIRYADDTQWYRMDQPHEILDIMLGDPVERRTRLQRKIRQTFSDGHSVEGWETQA